MTDTVEDTKEDSVEEDIGLYFKRFSKEKQDQVRALVNYATLMGLDGKDLVSIGGKLDRLKEKQVIMSNRAIVEGMNIGTIGRDHNCYDRWSYRSGSGMLYHFSNAGWHDVTIKNTTTNTRQTCTIMESYSFGRWRYKGSYHNHLPNVMLNVYHGHIKLP